MKFWSFTFGCKVNQYETELLRHRMMGRGDQQTNTIEEADVALINTCTVTQFADKECRQMIRRVLRKNSFARVIVTGCYATSSPDDIKAISDRIELYTNAEKDELPSCVGYELSDQPLGIHQFAGRTRAFLKIQDGCKAPCKYCIIPSVRPELKNKPVQDVLKEAQALIKNGYQEIVLTGIRLGLYRGQDSDGKRRSLIQLLEKLTTMPEKFRVRLSSLEVTEVSDQLIEFVKSNPKMCRHFHIPMQSGTTSVLKAMGRWYTADYYRDRVKAIRQAMPDCGLTADVMVGFPTETDDQFEETAKFIDEIEMSGLHVFRFSQRKGTEAADLKPLDPKIIAKRAHVLGLLDDKLRKRFYQEHAGTVREVVPEPSGEGWSDNYIRVKVPDHQQKNGLSHIKVWTDAFDPHQKRVDLHALPA